MRRTVTGSFLALLVLTACADGDPKAAPTTSPPATTPPATTAPATASPTPTWPAGCVSPPALPDGATVVTATVSGSTTTTAKKPWDVKLGSDVRILVTTDRADELHLHTYNARTATAPGCPAVIDFEATIPGTVEVELEKAHVHVLEIRAR